MTRELLTALESNAECGMINSELLETQDPEHNSEFRIPNSELSPAAASPEGGDHSEFEIPNSSLPGSAPDPELDALYRHFERLRAQTEGLRREIPDFDPALALRDPDFLRLTAPGVGMDPRRAWLALHPELLERRAARESAAALARSLASSASRPREGGGGAGATLAADYRSLPRAEQQRLKERILQAASRGEKIYP